MNETILYNPKLLNDFHTQQYLSAGLTLEELIQMIRGEKDPLRIPLGLPPLDLSQETKNSLYLVAGILGLSAILVASIIKK